MKPAREKKFFSDVMDQLAAKRAEKKAHKKTLSRFDVEQFFKLIGEL